MPEFKVFKGNREKVFKMFRRDSVALVFVILLAKVDFPHPDSPAKA